jgi:hypothetical protein
MDPCFSPDELRTLATVLDELVPPRPDGRLPGAGSLGLGGAVAQRLGDLPELRDVVARGLAALDDRARDRGRAGFGALPGPERVEALRALATADDGFLPGLFREAVIAYYQDPRVLVALGREPRPPYPGGYELEPFDETLLEPVRRRGRRYR